MNPGSSWTSRRAIAIAAVIVVCAVVAYGLYAAAAGRSTQSGGGASPPPTSTVSASISSAPPTAAAPSATQSSLASVVAASAPPSTVVAASGSATASGSAPGSALAAAVDPTLLAILPATVGGVSVREFPEAEQQAIADPDLGRNVTRVATAFVGDAAGTNWAYAAIVDVRPESRSDAFYRDWQDSFDASACERAGGVSGHSAFVIGGHDVERTACATGIRTYHVRVKDTGLLISISDLGDLKYGEQVIAGLRT